MHGPMYDTNMYWKKKNLRTNNWNNVMRLMDWDLFCHSYML